MQQATATSKRETQVKSGFFLPSAALCLSRKQFRKCLRLDRPPRVGDVVYGAVRYMGFHKTLENKRGRIHAINDGSHSLFVFGNRYAPDAFEGMVPDHFTPEAHMLARSGVIGAVTQKNANVPDPTRVELFGYACDKAGKVLNTLDYPLIKEPKQTTKAQKRARMILVVGTSMNSGKSRAAASICWALTALGHKVRGAKITGTASLKDILHMEDAGASPVADFTYFGYPSTYLLSQEQLLNIFNKLDLKHANNPSNFWVVEIADGVLQRETAILLASADVQSRINRLVFCGSDSLGVIAGVHVLKDRFGLQPDAISGLCSASPLASRELQGHIDVPVVSNTQYDLNGWSRVIL